MATPRVPVSQSPDELWVLVVLAHVEEELRRISESFPKTILPPDFENTFLGIAEKNFREAVCGTTNFKKWADEIKDWKEWAHGLIPYREINPTYLADLWDQLCKRKEAEEGFILVGMAPKTVKKLVRRLKPRDMDDEEFFDNVLNETCINFMRRYFSSFQEPMETWLYKLTQTSAQDFVKKWVPGMRLPKKEDRPKGFESLDKPQKGPEGEDREPLKETLTDRENSAVEKAKALAHTLLGIREQEGQAAKISDATIRLFYKFGYTEREIAHARKIRVRDVKAILDDDCARMAVIARQLGIRRRIGTPKSGAAGEKQ